jgi:hypothetical protein
MHMYGSNMGTLQLRIKEEGNGKITEFNVRSGAIAGQGEASPFQAYEYALNKADWVGTPGQRSTAITITFRAKRGNGYKSDMAIDDITFSPECSIDPIPSCPAGHEPIQYVNATTAKKYYNCDKCKAGFAKSTGKNTPCDVCDSNAAYADETGQATCKPTSCGGGQYRKGNTRPASSVKNAGFTCYDGSAVPVCEGKCAYCGTDGFCCKKVKTESDLDHSIANGCGQFAGTSYDKYLCSAPPAKQFDPAFRPSVNPSPADGEPPYIANVFDPTQPADCATCPKGKVRRRAYTDTRGVHGVLLDHVFCRIIW